jgi:hypothetical protein
MSSVCDENGVWWFHCGSCDGEGTPDYSPRGKWVRAEDLCFEEPSPAFPMGRDVCSDCAQFSIEQGKDVDLIPPIYTIDLPPGSPPADSL